MKFSKTKPTKTLHLVSLGCTKNLVDSEIMLGKLKEYKIINNPTVADVIIVNTCGFIDSAKEESINTILSLHDERKEQPAPPPGGAWRHPARCVRVQGEGKSIRMSRRMCARFVAGLCDEGPMPMVVP